MHPLPVPESHEYVMRTAGSVDQSVAPETTASGSQGRLKFQSPHGSRRGQSTHVIQNSHFMVVYHKINIYITIRFINKLSMKIIKSTRNYKDEFVS